MFDEIKHIVAEFSDMEELQQDGLQEAVKIAKLYLQMFEEHKEYKNKILAIIHDQDDEIVALTQKLENLEEIFRQELGEVVSTYKKHDQDMQQVLRDLRRSRQ